MRAVALLLMVLGVLRPGEARAHAILVESTPPISGAASAGEVNLRLRFNSRIDAARSRLTLVRPDKTTTVLPIETNAADELLLSHVRLPAGAYEVRWQVLAVDGHITRGILPFTLTGN